MNKRKIHLIRLVKLLAAIGFSAVAIFGCARKNPLDDVIDAPSDFKMMMWRADVADHFNFQEWRDFDEALQEIKFDVMIAKEASGSDAVRQAALQRIDGKTVRDALTYGYDLKLKRLLAEREKIGGFFAINKKFRTREGDEESARYLENLREEQARRLQTLDQQIEDVRAVLRRRNLILADPSNQTPATK